MTIATAIFFHFLAALAAAVVCHVFWTRRNVFLVVVVCITGVCSLHLMWVNKEAWVRENEKTIEFEKANYVYCYSVYSHSTMMECISAGDSHRNIHTYIAHKRIQFPQNVYECDIQQERKKHPFGIWYGVHLKCKQNPSKWNSTSTNCSIHECVVDVD